MEQFEDNSQEHSNSEKLDPIPFRVILTELRKSRGLTQEGLAARMGVSTSTVSKLEQGINAAPRSDTVPLFVMGLGLNNEEESQFLQSAGISSAGGLKERNTVDSAVGFDAHIQNEPQIAELLELLRSGTLQPGEAEALRNAVGFLVNLGRTATSGLHGNAAIAALMPDPDNPKNT